MAEQAEGSTLEDLVRAYAPFDADAVVRLARQLANELDALHQAGRAHGALSMGNVVVTELDDGRLTTRIVPAAVEESPDADLRALGGILQSACAGAPPEAYPSDLHEVLERLTTEEECERFRDTAELLDALDVLTTEGLDLFEDELPLGEVTASASPQSVRVSVGTVVDGRYELVRLLGRGGMGVVYEARDPDGALVAIKLVRADSTRQDEEAQRRFLREARTAMGIESEHVVSVREAGNDEALGLPFIVMELLGGEDLGKVLAREGPLDPDVAVRIIVDASRGLAEAHRTGLVHRDIKPGNIYLQELSDGTLRVKLCDFGIAKQDTALLGHSSTGLTQSRGLLGSPLYMSPEQAQNARSADARSDVWSMCISLYEALSGEPPWASCITIGQVLLRLYTRDVPSVREGAPWVSPRLAEAVHRGLQRDPTARYESAEALVAALEPFARKGPLRREDVRADGPREAMLVEPGRSRRAVWQIAAAAVLGVAVCGVAIWGIVSGGSGNETVEAPASASVPATVAEPAETKAAPPALPEPVAPVASASSTPRPERPRPVKRKPSAQPPPSNAPPPPRASAPAPPGTTPKLVQEW